MRNPDQLAVRCVAAVALSATLAACGGGGGGAGGFARHGVLLAVEFPGAADPDAPPDDAPLLQTVEFQFDAAPDPNAVSSTTLPIRDAAGFPVPGTYVVDGTTVRFTPRLPTVAPTTLPNGTVDVFDAGLEPGRRYTLRVSPASFHFLSHIDAALQRRFADPTASGGILLGFGTTTDPAHFLDGLEPVMPQVVAAVPEDGTSGFSPELHADPDARFPARAPLTFEFDRPLRPDPQNLGPGAIALLDLDDRPSSFPAGLPLGIDVRVAGNSVDGSLLEITPSGILPFGHLLALAIPADFKGISESGTPGAPTRVVTTFTVAAADSAPIHDDLVEDFDDTTRQESDPAAFAAGSVHAEWDERESQILRAGFAFQGDGALGRFLPPSPPVGEVRVINLDTARQVFPLPDGSTPDAPPNFQVTGGVFSFTDVDIPSGVILQPIGANPLVITATGTFRLAGEISLSAQDGNSDFVHDSAVTSLPGGPGGSGGGRGGEGQPILFFPPDQVAALNYVSPTHGGRGYGIDPVDGQMKAIGGTGGECGMLDHDDGTGHYTNGKEISCNEINHDNSNGVKPPGGGGGSLLTPGKHPQDPRTGIFIDGIGNVLVDGQGHYLVRPESEQTLLGGDPGDAPFFDDGDALNDFFGPTGQLHRLIGGQGGGAGASRIESYYCGVWCLNDLDPANDANCDGYDFGLNPKYADSVGDSRGGGAGGGGGAVMIQALGDITLEATARIRARGGNGGGAEQLGCSTFGGGGGGGAGGAIILQSGSTLTVRAGALVDASPGDGDSASDSDLSFTCDEGGSDGVAIGDGGKGGLGLIQLQVPAGDTPVVEDQASIVPLASWVDRTNILNPAAFTPDSVAISRWWDMGRAITRGAPGTLPAFRFGGLDPQGFVQTDAEGNVADPAATDIVCDDFGTLDPVTRQYLPGRSPRADFLPPGTAVRVEFQGGDALVEGSKEVDPASLTTWSPDVAIATGRQFLRWRVTFTIADANHPLTPLSPRPVVQQITVHSDF